MGWSEVKGPGRELRGEWGKTLRRLRRDPKRPEKEMRGLQPSTGLVLVVWAAQAGTSAPVGRTPTPLCPQEAEVSQLRIYWRKCNHIKT